MRAITINKKCFDVTSFPVFSPPYAKQACFQTGFFFRIVEYLPQVRPKKRAVGVVPVKAETLKHLPVTNKQLFHPFLQGIEAKRAWRRNDSFVLINSTIEYDHHLIVKIFFDLELNLWTERKGKFKKYSTTASNSKKNWTIRIFLIH